MARLVYVGVVHEERGVYGVSFPEVPGVVTVGADLAAAATKAEEALAFHLEGLAEDGEAWPEPQGLDAVRASEDAEGAVAFLAVPAPVRPGKLERLTITMDSNVLEKVDRAAAERGLNRSVFLSQAALDVMGSHRVIKGNRRQGQASVTERIKRGSKGDSGHAVVAGLKAATKGKAVRSTVSGALSERKATRSTKKSA